ncbi:MAG: class I SAM-dependent methyltransferase [bacterium]|nr:class I SAM-dependent methyltransferase [bacterium]
MNKSKTNTKKSFSDKWNNNPKLAFTESLKENSEIFNWILNRNGFKNSKEFRYYLKNKESILDAGCGNGRITALLRKYSPLTTKITGIDLTSAHIAKNNLKKFNNIKIIKKDLLENLTNLGKFDFIYCQEVLHHTNNPKKAFLNLCKILEPAGEIAIYVYKKKAPIREYVDDLIRYQISDLSYNKAIKACKQITDLGKMLSKNKIKIKVPDVDILEIKKGTYDLQRFIYYFFMKCYWNNNLTHNENTAINYDWYHPQLCFRYTIEDIQKWFKDANLKIIHEFTDFYGITMRGRKKLK